MENLDSIKAMLVFARVVQCGSFAEAARRLNLTRAVVSYHVKRLERQLDTQLLLRNTRNISLTPAGELFYRRCQLIADEAQAATDELASLTSNPMGKIRLTCSVNWGQKRIVPAVIAFRELYPKIEVELILTDEVVNLVEEGVDLAIRGAPLKDSELLSRKLVTEPCVLVASPGFIEQHSAPNTPEELSHLDWIIYTPSAPTLKLSQGDNNYRIRLHGPVKTNNSAARLSFVLAGQGIAKLPLWATQTYLDSGELIRLMPDYIIADTNIYGVYPRRVQSSNPIRLLVDFLRDNLNPQN